MEDILKDPNTRKFQENLKDLPEDENQTERFKEEIDDKKSN